MYSEHFNCLLCNSTSLKELKKYAHAYLVKCNSCDFVFIKRIPTNEELINHYNGYPRNNKISEITIKRYNELLDIFEKYRKTNNILDIGCGDGYFLETAKKRGWKVYGTEFTEDAINNCKQKGIEMHEGILDLKNYNSESFDVITSFEVIEHINNPQSEIKNLKKILRSGGAFYFTTPNFDSISKTILGNKWNIIEYPEHLSYYTPKTIHQFLQKNGFKRNYLATTGISLKRFSASLEKDQNSNTNNIDKDENLRGKIESKKILKLAKFILNVTLNTLKMGDTIKGIYIKN